MCIMQDSLPVYIWTLVAALVHFHVNLYHRSDSTLVTISAHTCASRWSSARRHHQSMETGSCRTPDTNARPTSPTSPRPICHFSTRHNLFFYKYFPFLEIHKARLSYSSFPSLHIAFTCWDLILWGRCILHFDMICIGFESVCKIFSNMSHQPRLMWTLGQRPSFCYRRAAGGDGRDWHNTRTPIVEINSEN